MAVSHSRSGQNADLSVCFVSHRLFDDGPVREPFPENDPANIAFALGGNYLSYYTLGHMSDDEMARFLAPYNLVIVTLDAEHIRLSRRVIQAAAGRAVGYSEGHVSDYQRLSPIEQAIFAETAAATRLNLLYWERYVPFFRVLSPTPVEYLPYPYPLEVPHERALPAADRESLVVLPTGLAGGTRNGLADLLVARRLRETNQVENILVCMDPENMQADIAATQNLLSGAPITAQRPSLWRALIRRFPVDYRPLLRLWQRLRTSVTTHSSPVVEVAAGLRVLRRTGWPTYLAAIAPARLMIDLNNRETVGRNALDCAALGIACVGTNRSDLQAKLYPATTLDDPWDVPGAIALGRRLLSEASFWQDVVVLAAERVAEYDVEPFRRRFAEIAGRHGLNMPLRG